MNANIFQSIDFIETAEEAQLSDNLVTVPANRSDDPAVPTTFQMMRPKNRL